MNNLKVTLGMVPDNCIEENAVSIEEFSITYCQNPDTNSGSDEYQHLKISAQNSGAGEEGWYFNLEIPEGEHWSINNSEEIMNIIEDFKKRLELNITKESNLEIYE